MNWLLVWLVCDDMCSGDGVATALCLRGEKVCPQTSPVGTQFSSYARWYCSLRYTPDPTALAKAAHEKLNIGAALLIMFMCRLLSNQEGGKKRQEDGGYFFAFGGFGTRHKDPSERVHSKETRQDKTAKQPKKERQDKASSVRFSLVRREKARWELAHEFNNEIVLFLCVSKRSSCFLLWYVFFSLCCYFCERVAVLSFSNS
jgi:hypothetical protein